MKVRTFTPAKGPETEAMLDKMFADTAGMIVIALKPDDLVQCVALDMDSRQAAEVLYECALMFKKASKAS